MKDGIAAVGDVLAGKYRVDKILGIGGMGMVVAATHLELDQRVALKFMLPSAAESPETAARFLREARAAGRLNSDHVCRMVDLGRLDSGAPYIVMEYLQGESLAALLRRHGALRVPDAVDYILQAIEGLAEAHAHGIVHRDLKPDNLFVHRRNDGGSVLKVLDFGISKISLHGVSTRTGDIMGSPAYMAPEQMESTRSVDARADVWSLGVVLYQLVTGRPPFHGDTLPLLCMHVVNDDPEPMSAIRGDLPDGFEDAVMRCLQKEPDHRYPDVGELARALEPFGLTNASTSASRIQIVLSRTGRHDSASAISTAGIPSAGAALDSERTPPNTLVGTSGQSLGGRSEGRSWGVAGAVLAGLGVGALVVVMLWRTGWFGDAELPGGPAVARPAQPEPAGPGAGPASAVEPARSPGPIVEPIVEDPPRAAAAPPGPAQPAAALPAPEVAPPSPSTAPATAVHTAPPPPDRHRHPPPRTRARPPRVGAGSGSAGPGSAAPAQDDDDKWMHMTHDVKPQR
ncbi:MAG TPA: serine/threonine-protein kinase [Kofleriaceae bacterium]|jgi:serine/threonine-protein kinase|nr:serine/threonine-protein kinase [Kofleriaceae bacterium]